MEDLDKVEESVIETPKKADKHVASPVIKAVEKHVAGSRIKTAFLKKKAEAEKLNKKVEWGRKSLMAKDPATGKFNKEIKPEDVKRLHDAGKSIREIAKELGCSTMPIVRVLRGEYG